MNFKKILTAGALIGVITPVGLSAAACGKLTPSAADTAIINAIDSETGTVESVAVNPDSLASNAETTPTIASVFTADNIGKALIADGNLPTDFKAEELTIDINKIFQVGSVTTAQSSDKIDWNLPAYTFQFQYDGVDNNGINVPIKLIKNYDAALIGDINKLSDSLSDTVIASKNVKASDYENEFAKNIIAAHLTPAEKSVFEPTKFKFEGSSHIQINNANLTDINLQTKGTLSCNFSYSYDGTLAGTQNISFTIIVQ